jgi:DHA3 family macrolide efflux protein-like MFS transporter
MRENLSVLRNPNFAKYFTAQFLSSIGNGMQFIAMSWLLYKLTGSVASMGWFLVITALPNIVFSPWIGVLVDRWDVRRICLAMDFLRSAILSYLVYEFLAGDIGPKLIYACEFLVVCCNGFYQPSAGILVRSVVPGTQLLPANVVRSMGAQMGLLLGAAVGGILLAEFGTEFVISVNIVSFILSGLLTWWVRRDALNGAAKPSARRTGLMAEFLDGMRYVRRNAYLVALAMMMVSVYLTLYVCNTLLPAFATKVLDVGTRGFGLIDASWAAGAIASGFVLTMIVRLVRPRQFMSIALVCLAGALVVLLTAQGLVQAMLAYFLIGFLTASIRVNTDTLLQLHVESSYLGRVQTTISMLISWLSLAVYMSVGYLGDSVSVRWIYLGVGLLVLAGALLPSLFVDNAKDQEMAGLPTR